MSPVRISVRNWRTTAASRFHATQVYRPLCHAGGQWRRIKGQVVAPDFEAAFPGHANAIGGLSDVYVKNDHATDLVHFIAGAVADHVIVSGPHFSVGRARSGPTRSGAVIEHRAH